MGFFEIFSKTSKLIWFHLLVKIGIIILHLCANYHVQAISSSWDIVVKGGQKGSKMGVFWIFSKTSHTIWFHLLVKKGIIILHICAKFHVQANISSRDIWVNVIKMGFYQYLTKVSITPKRLEISFNTMAFLESAWNLQSIEHWLSSVAPLFRKIMDFKDCVFLPNMAHINTLFSTKWSSQATLLVGWLVGWLVGQCQVRENHCKDFLVTWHEVRYW